MTDQVTHAHDMFVLCVTIHKCYGGYLGIEHLPCILICLPLSHVCSDGLSSHSFLILAGKDG